MFIFKPYLSYAFALIQLPLYFLAYIVIIIIAWLQFFFGPRVPSAAQLDVAAQRYYMAGLATSTHKTYLAEEWRYLDFCGSFSITALPASEATLCYFVTCLAQQGLADGTIRTYLSGVRQLQISHGFRDPNISQMPCLRQILKGIKVEKGKEGLPQRPRLPITPMILRRMKPYWKPSFNSVMLWAAAVVTFFSFCRSGAPTFPIQMWP